MKQRRGTRPFPSRLELNSSLLVVFVWGCILGFLIYPLVEADGEATDAKKAVIRVCFSPEGRCTQQIIAEIQKARASILVMAYAFTSPDIAHALVEAAQRGVRVQMLIDKSQVTDRRSQCVLLEEKGISVGVDPAVGIAHNKIMIFDEHLVLTGSFNFTRSAESRNAENIVLIDDPALAKIYHRNWHERAARSKPLAFSRARKSVSQRN